jgi:GNAT superfamily N-acetyltransferase
MAELQVAKTAEDFDAARALFRAYERAVRAAPCFEGFERELAELSTRYAPPCGLLLLAHAAGAAGADGPPAGCVALRDMGERAGARAGERVAEAKRLFVLPEGRGRGVGAALLARLVAEARAAGYGALRLETLPGEMDAAIAMYRRAGFRPIAPYVAAPVPGALYLELELASP